MRRPRHSGFWIATVLGRGISAAKEVALAMVFATTGYKDALVLAWSVPTLLATYCSESLPALLIPRWTAPNGDKRTRGLVLAVSAVLALLSVGAAAWPRAVVEMLAPAWAGAQLSQAAQLVRWLAVSIALLGGQAMAGARLNAKRRFVWAPIAAAAPAAGVLLALTASLRQPAATRLVAVAAGLSAGAAAGLLLLLGAIVATRSRGGAPATVASGAPAMRPLGALLLAMLVLNLVPLAEQMAAASLTAGSLAGYDYGRRLMLFVFGLTVAPFTAVQFTSLSEAAPGAEAGFARQVEGDIRRLMAAVLPLGAVLAVFASLITRCVYGWGHFGMASIALTSPVVAILGAGMGLDALFYYVLFALYARQQAASKLPLALVLAGVNVPLAFLAAAEWGVSGLACAHVAGYAAALGWMALRRREWLPQVGWRRALGPGAEAGAFTLAAGWGVRALLPTAAVSGRMDCARSWTWAAVAVMSTGAAAWLLTHWLTPGWSLRPEVPGVIEAI